MTGSEKAQKVFSMKIGDCIYYKNNKYILEEITFGNSYNFKKYGELKDGDIESINIKNMFLEKDFKYDPIKFYDESSLLKDIELEPEIKIYPREEPYKKEYIEKMYGVISLNEEETISKSLVLEILKNIYVNIN